MHLKMSSGKWRPFCIGLNVLIPYYGVMERTYVNPPPPPPPPPHTPTPTPPTPPPPHPHPHAAHTIVSLPNPKQYFRFDDDNKIKYALSQSSQENWTSWRHTAHMKYAYQRHSFIKYTMADSGFAPSQWETVLSCNDVSHWLGANLESALSTYLAIHKWLMTSDWQRDLCKFNETMSILSNI